MLRQANFYHSYIEPLRRFKRSARFFLLMTVINGIIFSSWSLFFNFYMLQSGHSRDFLGLVNSAPSFAGLLLGIPIGWLSDRLGRKRAMVLGLMLASLAMALQVTVREPNLILAMALLTGTSNTLFMISQAPLMMKLSEAENRTLLFSLNFGLLTLSGSVGNLFAGQLPAIFGSLLHVEPRSAAAYQAVLVASVLLGTTALIPLLMMKEPVSSPTPASEKKRGGLSSGFVPMTVRLALPNVLIGFGAAILIPYMNVFFLDKFHIPDSLLGALFSLSALLVGIGSLIGPRLEARLGSKVKTIVLTQSTSLVFLLVAGFSPLLWLAAIGFLMRAALMNMVAPLYNAFSMEQTPEREQGIVNSILGLSWQIGWAVGPYISGVVQENYGFTPLFLATGVLYFVAILLTWTFFNHAERKPAPEMAGEALREIA